MMMRRHFCQTLAAFTQTGGLADAVAQVVKLGAANTARALYLDLGDLRRVKRKYSFHALALNDAADGEHRPQAFTLPGDDDAAEDLDAFLLAFQNSLTHLDLI